MPSITPDSRYRHFIYRKEVWKTTWKLRGGLILVAFLALVLPYRFWTERLAAGLVCEEASSKSDAILVENFDPTYLAFERAATLQRQGIAGRILVPVRADGDSDQPNAVYRGVVDVMASIARLEHYEVIPIHETEPISLNAARQIRDFLKRENLSSFVLVSPALRSRRSAMVYRTVLTPESIRIACVPVFGTTTPKTWTKTWHGMQEVAEQSLKLLYYRFWVL